jgi:chemotaxis protein histidine kinase CheA
VEKQSAEQLERVTQLLLDQADALNDQVDGSIAAGDAKQAENDAFAAYGETLNDATASTDDLTGSAIALAKAHIATVEAQNRAAGTTQTATQKVDTFNDALFDVAGTLNGPARTALGNYIADVNTVPESKRTEFIALVEAGKLDEARALLDGTSQSRTAAIHADADTAAANAELANTANPNGRPRTAYIKPVMTGSIGYVIGERDQNGNIKPTMAPSDPAVAGLAAPAAAPSGPSFSSAPSSSFAVPVTVAVPAVTVNVSAAVIGNRFDVARAVRAATRDGIRLAGRR